MKQKKWFDYLWIFSSVYLLLGLFNIMFAYLGLICFITPLLIAIFRGTKTYCNYYCGRGQLFMLVAEKFKLSLNRECPAWLKSKWWRYGFLIFFLVMFSNMLYMTYRVMQNVESLAKVVKLFWTFKLGWSFAYHGGITWMVQFAYGFYSLMLTSTLLGFIVMFLYRPRTWCVFCPMGTMTQTITKLKHHKAL